MRSQRVAGILSALNADRREGSTRSAAQRLVDDCVTTVEVGGVGLILMHGTRPAGMVAASDGPATAIEELQFVLGAGPCVDASRTGHPVLVPDLAVSGPQRWPAFTEGALAAGVRAIFAYPLRVGAARVGVLDLYRDRTGPLTDDQHRLALDYAGAATAVLLHLLGQPFPGSTNDAGGGVSGEDDVPALVAVVDDRAEVHQATGVVAAQSDVGMPEASLLLRGRAYATGRPVLDLARDVLARRLTFVADAGPSSDGRSRIDVQDSATGGDDSERA